MEDGSASSLLLIPGTSTRMCHLSYLACFICVMLFQPSLFLEVYFMGFFVLFQEFSSVLFHQQPGALPTALPREVCLHLYNLLFL